MTYAQNMTAHFLYGDALLSVEGQRELQQQVLGQLGLSEISDFDGLSPARRGQGRAGLRAQARAPSRAEPLRAAVARAEGADPGLGPAGAERRRAGRRAASAGLRRARGEVIDEIGATVWKLSNGATVVIKPTRFNPGEVLFQARAAGGTSLASDRDYWSASLATRSSTAGGLGEDEPEELENGSRGAARRGIPGSPKPSRAFAAARLPKIWSSCSSSSTWASRAPGRSGSVRGGPGLAGASSCGPGTRIRPARSPRFAGSSRSATTRDDVRPR